MSLLSYNSCYIRVKRLFSQLFNHVQQHIVDQNKNHIALLPNNGSISMSIFQFYLLNCKSRIIHIRSSFQEFM